MLMLLSPAKSLDFDSPLPELPETEPRFADEALDMAKAASVLKADDLRRLMHISDDLATLNVGRYADFPDQEQRPALYAFHGDVYRGFEPATLPDEAILFAQQHVRILSGLYGLLRPLDRIRAYRMEMGTRWAPGGGTLYRYWGDRIARAILDELAEEAEPVIVNLASKEYFKAAGPHLDGKARVIDIDFREENPKGLRFNTFAAKRARGMMARYACEHHLQHVEALKAFDSDGYAFDPGASNETMWRFIRSAA